MQQMRDNTKKQDKRLDEMADGVATLKGEAQNFQTEVQRQNKQLDGINDKVEKTEIKMKKLDSKLDRYIAESDDSKLKWYIIGQVLVTILLICI